MNDLQVEDNVKVNFSNIFLTFKSFFSTSQEIEEKDLENRIKKIEKEQDNEYINNLEKAVTTYAETSKKSKAKNAKVSLKTNTKTAKSQSNINKEIELDGEEKEL